MSEENFLKIGLDHFSPSQLLRPTPNWLFEYVYLTKDQRRAITVGENAAYGTAVHNGIQDFLIHNTPLNVSLSITGTVNDHTSFCHLWQVIFQININT